jgi:hypothetical protein
LTVVDRIVIEYHLYKNQPGNLGEIITLLESRSFSRFRLFGHSEFDWQDMALPSYCCLLEAVRKR